MKPAAEGCGLPSAAEAGGLAARPAGAGDEAFLFAVYASSRRGETALMPWGQEQIDTFLRLQCAAQRHDYERRFPAGAHEIVLLDGRPIGRVWTARSGGELRLLDVTLLEEHRGRGLGTRLMRALQGQAGRLELPLRLCVWKANENAVRFYRRLGFEPAEDLGLYLAMEWLPKPSPAPDGPSIAKKE